MRKFYSHQDNLAFSRKISIPIKKKKECPKRSLKKTRWKFNKRIVGGFCELNFFCILYQPICKMGYIFIYSPETFLRIFFWINSLVLGDHMAHTPFKTNLH